MADIFLSYASEDRPRAQRVAAALQSLGWTVWWDRKIPAGRTFVDVIEEAISASRCVIVLWSKESVGSKWVREEADEGEKGRKLIPVLLDEVKPPMGFRSIHAADLIAWDSSISTPGFKQLVADLESLVGPPPKFAEPPVSRTPSKDAKPAVSTDEPPEARGSRRRWVAFAVIGSVVIVLGGWGVNAYVTKQKAPAAAKLVIPGTSHRFVEKDGYLVSTANGNPLCPTPPGWRTGCYALESQYQRDWRNTPDGYVANGKKVKTFTNRGEHVFEILGTKHAFYVDDGFLFHYATATILCPWPKAGVAKCHTIEAQYQDKWRNTPEGFIADGHAYNAIGVMRDVRQGLF